MLFWKRTLICLVIIAVILTIAMPANAAELTETELQENPYLIEYEGNKFIVSDLSRIVIQTAGIIKAHTRIGYGVIDSNTIERIGQPFNTLFKFARFFT